jgi:hypothetical protein
VADFAAKKGKTMTRRGFQQKSVVAPAFGLANLSSKQVQHFPNPNEMS